MDAAASACLRDDLRAFSPASHPLTTRVNSGDRPHVSTLLTPCSVPEFLGQEAEFIGQEGCRRVPEVLGGLTIERVGSGRVLAQDDGSLTTEMRYLGRGPQLSRARRRGGAARPDPEDGYLTPHRAEPGRTRWPASLPAPEAG